MRIIGGALGIGGSIACCALLFAGVMVALVLWYWRHQPVQQVSSTPPVPPVQATIEHPTAATTSEPVAPPTPSAPQISAPASESEPPTAFQPPSADA